MGDHLLITAVHCTKLIICIKGVVCNTIALSWWTTVCSSGGVETLKYCAHSQPQCAQYGKGLYGFLKTHKIFIHANLCRCQSQSKRSGCYFTDVYEWSAQGETLKSLFGNNATPCFLSGKAINRSTPPDSSYSNLSTWCSTPPLNSHTHAHTCILFATFLMQLSSELALFVFPYKNRCTHASVWVCTCVISDDPL